MSEPNCVNAEIMAGQHAELVFSALLGEPGSDGSDDASVITSTLQEDVGGGLSALSIVQAIASFPRLSEAIDAQQVSRQDVTRKHEACCTKSPGQGWLSCLPLCFESETPR